MERKVRRQETFTKSSHGSQRKGACKQLGILHVSNWEDPQASAGYRPAALTNQEKPKQRPQSAGTGARDRPRSPSHVGFGTGYSDSSGPRLPSAPTRSQRPHSAAAPAPRKRSASQGWRGPSPVGRGSSGLQGSWKALDGDHSALGTASEVAVAVARKARREGLARLSLRLCRALNILSC